MRRRALALPSLAALALVTACSAAGDDNPSSSGASSTTSSSTGGGGVCGDAVVDPGEGCDDGNTQDGDGCSSVCQPEGQGGGSAGGSGGAGGVGGSGGDGGSGGMAQISCSQTINMVAPVDDSFITQNGTLFASASVADPNNGPLNVLSVQWEDSNQQVLGVSSVDANGISTTNLTVAAAVGQLHARVITPQGACDTTASKRLYVCFDSLIETFNSAINPADWTIYGSASWNPGGWLEMTGLSQNQQGAIYNDQYVVSSGNASLSFKIFTGGSSPGADGFAITIIETQQPGDLQTWVSAAHNGGGLGYAVGGGYGSFGGSAFTVEIDTWFNTFNGTTELHTDPIMGDHLEITLGADPAQSLVHTALPNVQDQQWHDIRVDIIGSRVRVWYDNQLAIDVTDPSLLFKGGRLFFSGSTGFYYNWHRFDDLVVNHSCL